MKVPKDNFYHEALEYLTEARFSGRGYCCVKLRNSDGDMPKSFGVVYCGDPCEIFLRNDVGDLTDNVVKFNSVEEMLDAGWDVD